MPVTAPLRPTPPGPTRRQPFLTATTTPDATLVALAARGDERAFEVLFQRHRTDVLAYATRMLRDHGRAEDVVQDVFVSAMRAIVGAPEDRHPVHVRAWLREIARRVCIDQWRGTTRRGEVSLDAPERLLAGDALRLADEDSLTRATDDREAVATLRRAFADLPELQHAVLVQRELEGRSIAEIAARLQLTPTVVEGQLSRGRRALGQAYRELESGERCVAVRALCDASLGGRLGVRDRHRVGRHVQGCDGCRRYARQSGVDPHLVDRTLLSRASLLLPLPLLRRLPVDHTIAGEAAGGLLGAKMLVGAAVVAAGSGGVYVTHVETPLSPPKSKSAPTDPAASVLGVRPGPEGTPILRVPGVPGLAATTVLPVTGPGDGARAVRPFLPPWMAESAGAPRGDASTPVPGASSGAGTTDPPTAGTPTPPAASSPAAVPPAASPVAPAAPSAPAAAPPTGSTGSSIPSRPSSSAAAPPTREVPPTSPTADPLEQDPARGPEPTAPAQADPAPGAEAPAEEPVSSDDTPASAETPVQQSEQAPVPDAPAPAPAAPSDDVPLEPAPVADPPPADAPPAQVPEVEAPTEAAPVAVAPAAVDPDPAPAVEVPAGAAPGGS